MKHKITFSMGLGLTAAGAAMEHTEEKQAAAFKYCADIFKGYTVYHTSGGWVAPDGRLCQEPSMVIEVYHDNPSREDLIKPTAQYFRRLFDQECVMVTVTPCTVEFYL